MTKSNRALALVMTLIMLLSTFASASVFGVNAAAKPKFTINNVDSITPKNAHISAKITNPSKGTIKSVGFKIGTSKSNLNTGAQDSIPSKLKKASYINADYKMSDDNITLKPNTTYYYQFWINISDKVYNSDIKSFKTKKAPAFTINSTNGITATNATINGKVTNPNKTKTTEVWFQIGTNKSKLTNSVKKDKGSWYNSELTLKYNITKYYGKLKADTTYYYRFCVKTGRETFYSDTKSFKTKSTIPTIATPTAASATHNDATLKFTVSNPYKVKIEKSGYMLGTSKSKLSTEYKKNINSTKDSQTIAFKLSDNKVTLKANTTYYYKTYIIVGGKTYYSTVQSFKTLPNTPTFTYSKVSDLKYNDATLKATVNNPAGQKITEQGYEIGTKKTALNTKKVKSTKATSSTSFPLSYTLSKDKITLKESTTYYYRTYVVANGKRYYGAIQSFKTPAKVKYPAIKSLEISRIVQPQPTTYDNNGNLKTDSSCYLTSVATIYGYKLGTHSGTNYRVGGKDVSQSNSALYKEFFKNNGNKVWVDKVFTKYKLNKSEFTFEKAYNSLKAGKPVVVHYNHVVPEIINGKTVDVKKMHASIIIGYKGNSNKLNVSDFIVMEIKEGYAYNNKLCNKGYWDNSTSLYKSYANKGEGESYFQSTSCYMTLDKWLSPVKGRYPQYMVTY